MRHPTMTQIVISPSYRFSTLFLARCWPYVTWHCSVSSDKGIGSCVPGSIRSPKMKWREITRRKEINHSPLLRCWLDRASRLPFSFFFFNVSTECLDVINIIPKSLLVLTLLVLLLNSIVTGD